MNKKSKVDNKGRHLGENITYDRNRKRYRYSYKDASGEFRSIYSTSLDKLMDRINNIDSMLIDVMNCYEVEKTTVNDVFDRYLSSKVNLRSTTMSNYTYMYDKFIRPSFGKKKIAKIVFSDILLFYKGLLSKMSVNTVEVVNTILRPTFQFALRDNLIRNNPVDGALSELKKTSKFVTEDRKALSQAEQKMFFSLLEDPRSKRWENLFIVLFGTGCRVGEFTALTWNDIDFENRIITIDHNLTYRPRVENHNKCEYHITETKTKAGMRTIPMIDRVYQALMDEKIYQETTGLKCDSVIDGYEGFIFFNRFKSVHNQSSINAVIKRLICKYNASEELKAKREKRNPIFIPPFSCHIARHTFCTRLYENGVDIKTIQSVMGHKDIGTTLDIYAEISESKKKEVFTTLDDNFVV